MLQTPPVVQPHRCNRIKSPLCSPAARCSLVLLPSPLRPILTFETTTLHLFPHKKSSHWDHELIVKLLADMTQESAFKPYHKFDVPAMVTDFHPIDKSDERDDPVSSSPISSSWRKSSTSSPIETPQIKPFDYTVEKILKSSPPSVSSTVPNRALDESQILVSQSNPSLYEIAKWNNIPLSLIARHIWWQNQRSASGMSEVTSREVTSSDFTSTSSSMCESC